MNTWQDIKKISMLEAAQDPAVVAAGLDNVEGGSHLTLKRKKLTNQLLNTARNNVRKSLHWRTSKEMEHSF